MERSLYLSALLCILCIQNINGGPYEVMLIENLTANYNSYERPAEVDNTPLKVEFLVTIRQIIDLDEKNQMLNSNLWLTIRWIDYKLRWDPKDFGNVTRIVLPAKILWKPDILMYNSADPSFDSSYPTNMVVKSDGIVEQIPPGIFISACPLDIKWFPFDDQNCSLKFGSWSYDGSGIDLQILEGKTNASDDGYSPSGEWDVLDVPVVRNSQAYDCCPDNPFIDLTFTIMLRRRKLYYMVNIVTPCLMLAALTLVTFTIPPEAGEKISFGVTILLSLTVFLLLVAESLPPTSDAVPLIALYFSCVMFMNAASVIFTVVVLNFHHRTSETHNMPRWVKKGICVWLAWILRIERPGHDIKAQVMRNIRYFDSGSEMTEFSPSSPQSRSLLANVKNDEDYNYSLPQSPMNGTRNRKADHNTHKMRIDARSVTSEFSPTRYELRSILKELRFITDKMKAQDEDDATNSDWKFSAIVVDRFLLWFFSIFTVLSSLGMILSAPNIAN